MPYKDPERRKQNSADNYKRNGDKLRMQVRLHRYGMSVAEYNKMFEEQEKVCACCGSPDPGKMNGWHIDHDWETKEIRGILCGPCNRIAGSNEEHIVRIRLVTRFLEKFYGRG